MGLVAVSALVLLAAAVPSQAAARSPAPQLGSTQLPDSSAGRQLDWLLAASARLPVSDAELRAHFSEWFLSSPGLSPAAINAALETAAGPGGLQLVALTLVQSNALVASVTGRDGQALVVAVVTDRAGRIDFGVIRPSAAPPEVTLPAPTGRAAVGTDVVQVVDRVRRGRRLLLTRWYPATSGARHRPPAVYTSPLRAALGIAPSARVHARAGVRARRGRLPVVLFSPGSGTARDIYQSLAEDLASHGYLVVAVDHTGETPVQFPDGHVEGRSVPLRHLIRTEAATRLADMRLVLRRLNTLAPGPRADRRRVAAVGHSLGGSTAAALMRAEPTVRAGADLDGSIFGPARRLGVARPFLVMVGGEGLDRSLRGLLEHSRGPRLALRIAGFVHFSFSDLPVTNPAAIGAPRVPSARDIALQRAYLRAFLDRYVRGRRSGLLAGPSRHWPQVSFAYRRRCCA
jgi:dienelactone hydrolase